MFTDTSLQPGLVNPSRNDEHLISGFALQLVDYLTRQLSRPDLAHGVLATARRFKSLDEDEQWKNLPATYLVFEQYLVELDPCKKFLREQLREIVKTRFGLLVDALPEFSLIFQPSAKQEVLLCTKFLSAVLDEAASFIWGDLREQVRVTGLWLHGSLQDPMPPLVQACVSSVPKDDHGWVALLKTFSRSMFLLFQRRFGERSTSGIFSRAYGQIADTYIALETFPAVIDLLPEILLDREKTALFHLGRIRKSVTERTDQLHEINEQLLSKNKELAVMRAELNKANDRLELRVKQRTSELERANERLRGEIDERHRAELALRLSQEYARNIIDSSLDMIIAVDKDRNVIEFNRAAQLTFGYEKDEIIGRDVSILYGTVDDSNEVHRATLVRGAYVREVVNRRKNGELFPSLLSASLLKDANGEVIGYMGISRDRTMEQRAEEELRTSEEKYRTLFEESRDVIFMCTLTGTLLDINPAGVDLLGYASKKELLDVNLFQGVILDLGEKEAYHHALDTNGFVKDFRITLVRKDGKKLTVTVTANAVRNSRGSIVAYRGIMRDVTERQQLEQQLMQSQKLESIGLLAGGIAHDINNVLTPIIVGIEFLKGKETNNEARKMFDMIGTSARRGAEIVKQVLTIGRRVTGERTEVQLKHLLKEMAKVAVETFPKSIRMQTSLPDDVWMVSGDATQLHQILLNLCVNARDAMPNGGTLTMGAKNVFLDEHYAHLHVDAKPGPYVLLQVSDTGSGIPGEIIHKIFEPFYTTKEPGKGTGLGLSTVHAIVKNHNGFVNVYSEVGKGTRFNVYLPAHQNAVMREQERAGRVFSNGNGETILVVDDEPSVLEITTATLEKFGYKTLRACDGTQAIALFAKNRGEVRAVITDMSMPVMDGSSTIKALRRIESNAKIIAASGLAEHKSKIEVAGLRVEAFLEKPYTAEALLGTLQEVLSS